MGLWFPISNWSISNWCHSQCPGYWNDCCYATSKVHYFHNRFIVSHSNNLFCIWEVNKFASLLKLPSFFSFWKKIHTAVVKDILLSTLTYHQVQIVEESKSYNLRTAIFFFTFLLPSYDLFLEENFWGINTNWFSNLKWGYLISTLFH